MKTLLLTFVMLMSSLVVNNATADEETLVWICTGRDSQCYHRIEDCRGLSSCSGNLRQVSLKTAQTIDRRECRICYKQPRVVSTEEQQK